MHERVRSWKGLGKVLDKLWKCLVRYWRDRDRVLLRSWKGLGKALVMSWNVLGRSG